MRYIYLAGPIQIEGDTWRARTTKELENMGFTALDPLRNEDIKKVGKHLESDLTDRLIVRRDLDDLKRVAMSGGLMLANLNTTSDGRRPTGTLFELMHAYDYKIPVISVLGRETDVNIRTHPWVKYCSTYEASSLTDALEAIRKYFG